MDNNPSHPDTPHMEISPIKDLAAIGQTNPVRRPMNAFLIFCKRHRAVVREKNAHLDNRSVTKILGELWANLPMEEKSIYVDLAKQYKDAFMRANPDYKWHDPYRSGALQGVPRSPTKLLPGPIYGPGGQTSLGEGITPGKLADESNMGGLSLLLMAGQRSLSPSNAAAPSSGNSSAPGGGPGNYSAVKQAAPPAVDLECRETEEDLSDTDEEDEKKKSSSKTDSKSQEKPVAMDTSKLPVAMTTSMKGVTGGQKKEGGMALFQLAEMCSSQFPAPNDSNDAKPHPSQPKPLIDQPPTSTGDSTSDRGPSSGLPTPPWNPQYDSGLSQTTMDGSKVSGNQGGVELKHNPNPTNRENQGSVDLYCHEKVTPNTDFCRELDRRPLVDQILRSTRELPGCAYPGSALQGKSPNLLPKPENSAAAADLLRVLNAPTKVDHRPALLNNPPTMSLPPIPQRFQEPNDRVRTERLGDLSQRMVERVIETVYSRDLLSCDPLGPPRNPGDSVPQREATFGEMQESLIRQAVVETEGRQFANRVREQLQMLTQETPAPKTTAAADPASRIRDKLNAAKKPAQRKKKRTQSLAEKSTAEPPPQKPEPMETAEDDSPEGAGLGVESDGEGDGGSGVRKSKRSNRGQRYKALLSQGLLQPARRKYEPGDDNNNTASTTLTSDLELMGRRDRPRTMSENAKDDAEYGQRYKPGDFDLDAHIASLPVCHNIAASSATQHSLGGATTTQAGGRGNTGGKPRGAGKPAASAGSPAGALTIAELKCITKSCGGPPGVTTVVPTATGSRKRKARRNAITHLLPAKQPAMPPVTMTTQLSDNAKENTDSNNTMSATGHQGGDTAPCGKSAPDGFGLNTLVQAAVTEQHCGPPDNLATTTTAAAKSEPVTVGCM